MRRVRRATVALLGMFVVVSAGCHRAGTTPLSPDDRARLYSAVLLDLRPDTVMRWVVIDSLLPTTEIDADMHGKVISELGISGMTLDRFLAVQRAPVDRFQPAMLPGGRFIPLRAAQLDSMRRAVRDEIARGVTERGAANDLFWRRWSGAFPRAGGYVILSPAMISANGREAMVHVRIQCGPVCGDAELRHLRRDTDGAWRTTAKVRLSES